MKYFRPIIALICSLSLLCGMVPSVVFAGTETMTFEAEETPISDALDLSSLTAEDFSLDTSIIVVLTVIFGYVVPVALAVLGLVVYLRRRRL